MSITLSPLIKPLQGQLNIPGDKSISHRAIMIGALSVGTTKVTNFLDGEDCLRTIKIFEQMGVSITQEGTNVTVQSNGYDGLIEPTEPLYFGNSGTTARLMLGILSGLPFHTVMHGDPHLTIRPMDRVVTPLRQMGAMIDGREKGLYLPVAVRGGKLTGMRYEIPVKSAQVKSAILFAGLFAQGNTTVVELAKTRDHTENVLQAAGAELDIHENEITIKQTKGLQALDIIVPGDISSAAFFLVAGAIVPNSKIVLNNVGLNETRTGILDVMKKMGANISKKNVRESGGELIGDLIVKTSELTATTISGEIMPRLIDEIPIIALLATQANGTTVIKDAEELRVKETDRIKAVVEVLSTLGANIEEINDGIVIHGKTSLLGGDIKGYSDHRMAMMGVIASFICSKTVTIDDISSIAVSYPTFFDDIKKLIR